MTDSETKYLKGAIKVGLSPRAASVYVVLLEAGTGLSPKNIISRTKLHRQYVYDALRELRDMGLVGTTGGGRRIHYLAASPERLSQDAEKKRIDVLDGVQHLMQLYDRSPAGIVEVIRGGSAVMESEFALLRDSEEGGFLDIVGGAGMNWVNLFHDRLEEYEALRRTKRIKLRYIGGVDDVKHNWEESIIENESRVIPDIGHVVNVAIRPGSVTFNIYEPEILAVRVRNEAAVASQRVLFDVLWSAAQK